MCESKQFVVLSIGHIVENMHTFQEGTDSVEFASLCQFHQLTERCRVGFAHVGGHFHWEMSSESMDVANGKVHGFEIRLAQ